jgi:hypothetical protein
VTEEKRHALILDPSAKNVGGHYLEFAKRMAHILSHDFEVSILASKFLKNATVKAEFRIVPTFTYGYWERPFHNLFLKKIYLSLQRKKSLRLRAKIRLLIAINLEDRNLKSTCFKFVALLVSPLLVLIKNGITILQKPGVKLSQRRGVPNLSWKFSVNGYPNLVTRLKGRKFRNELTSFINSTNYQPSLVFCGTITAIELYELTEFFKAKKNPPKVIIVLRREPSEENLSRQFWLKLGRAVSSDIYEIYADTDLLAELWSNTLELPVKIFPIPTWDSSDFPAPGNSAFLNLSYLGDARMEKSFNELVELVPTVLAHNKKLSIQINYQGGAGLTVEPARNHIIHKTSSSITVVDNALSSSEYRDAIFLSNLIYINYDPFNYRYRSSGVFVEAVTANKPVLVSNGSWMHYELTKLSRPYWEHLFDSFEKKFFGSSNVALLRNSLLRFNSPYKEQRIEFCFKLNTGITLICSSWTDRSGLGFLVVPSLEESENIIDLTPFNGNLKINDFEKVDLAVGSLKYVAGVVAEQGRGRQAVLEFYSKENEYIESVHEWTTRFKSFHSPENLAKTISRNYVA